MKKKMMKKKMMMRTMMMRKRKEVEAIMKSHS